MKNQFNNPAHQAYLNEAEEMFFGFEGTPFTSEDAFAFNQGSNPNLLSADGDGASAPQAVQMPDFDSVLQITVTETGGVDTDVVLFNANTTLSQTNFGNPANITIDVADSNYQTSLQTSIGLPYRSRAIRVEAFAETDNQIRRQLRSTLIVSKRNQYGVLAQYPIRMNVYKSPFQQLFDIINIAPYAITIDGQTGVNFRILANTEITFTFFIGTQVAPSNELQGRPTMQIATDPLPIAQAGVLSLSPNTVNALAR